MQAQHIVFKSPGEVALEPFDCPEPSAGEILVRMEQTVVSPGTELAILSGSEAWCRMPCTPGYGSIGRVIAVGSDVTDRKIGERLLSYCHHASVDTIRCMAVPVPEGLDGTLATFARMGQVSITARRIAQAELGDTVAVLGMGPVGNMAAQLFALSGCDVIAIDRDAARLETAKRCGIKYQVLADDNTLTAVTDITNGRLCTTVVEATGVPAVAATAAQYAGKLGEVILLGSPRGEHLADMTPFLNQIHLWGKCVTFKGAHEWRFPLYQDWNFHSKHSLESNLNLLLAMIQDGRLHIRELITHVLSPTKCAEAYRGLRERKNEYLGVVFDWTQLGA